MTDAAAFDPLPILLPRLAALDPVRSATAAREELVARWRAGEEIRAESFLQGLSAVAAQPELAMLIITGEVHARNATGQAPTLEEYEHRFPMLLTRLAAQFALIEGLATGSASSLSAGGLEPTIGTSDSVLGDFSLDLQQTISGLSPLGEESDNDLGNLGHYRLIKLLGQGGMGMVFLAEDTRLERAVALKVMRPSIAKITTAHERFLREAKAAAAVKHDHIVTIYQVDEHASTPFLAMELLDGVPLDRWLRANPAAPVRESVRIGRETAEGLAAAHGRGLIHRDIKPANLWIEAQNGRVKILDFGLARPAQENAQLSGSGSIVGTPSYMAPEQARGGAVDPRADLFSLGVVMYRMVTGRAPFTGTSVMAILTSLAVDTPTPIQDHNPNVPPALARLIEQLLEKEPSRRPNSAAEVARSLGQIEKALEFIELPQVVQIEYPSENVWSQLDLTEADPSVPEATTVPDEPPAPRFVKELKPKTRSARWVAVAMWALLALLTAGAATTLYRQFGPDRQPSSDRADADDTEPTTPNRQPTRKPPELIPAVFVPPLDDGFSPLDNLDPAKIPASEKFAWQPMELVAVIGSHKMRHWGEIQQIMYSPKGDCVVTAAADGVRLWDAKTMAETAWLPARPPGSAPIPHFSPDGTQLAVWWGANATDIFDLEKGIPKQRHVVPIICHSNPFFPNGKRVIGSGARAWEVWNIAGDTPAKELELPNTFEAALWY